LLDEVMTTQRTLLSQRGFTLIELMVVVAIIVVTLVLAFPSFQTFQRNAQLTSLSNSMIASINAARSEAMKSGNAAMVVPFDGINWSSGWIVFVDVARSQSATGNDGHIILKAPLDPAVASYITISATSTATGANPYLMFDAQGYTSNKNASFTNVNFSLSRNDVATTQTSFETRRVILSNTGKSRVCRPSTDTTCTATATS
jgi:type IV fimbrial biogenesis protein FimT